MLLYNKAETKNHRKILRKNLTAEEKVVWNIIRNRKVLGLKFFRQYGIDNYIADFYCPQARLVIEIDGGQHSNAISTEYDQKRTDYFTSLRIVVIRFWNNEVRENSEGVYQKIYVIAQKQLNSP
jgi:very-short-patch-repair endonuclease